MATAPEFLTIEDFDKLCGSESGLESLWADGSVSGDYVLGSATRPLI